MTTSTSRRSSSRHRRTFATTGGAVHVVCSSRADGSFHRDLVDGPTIERRTRAIVDLPWLLLDEVHGTDAVGLHDIDDYESCRGSVGDIAVTSLGDVVMGVWVGDCAPVVLVRADGCIAAVHAGWRGLANGVLDRAVDTLRSAPAAGGDRPAPEEPLSIIGYLGPCIGPCCYEFGVDDLDAVADALDLDVATISGVDRAGRTALDVPAAVIAVLDRHDVPVEHDSMCTGCVPSLYSHRRRGDLGRHVVGAWREAR